jgi:beta propeller repeat protein
MKSKILFIALTVVCLIGSISMVTAVQVTKIGDGYDPAIYGSNITWADQSGVIHLYDLSTEKDTKINSSKASHPAIYGNKLVWYDESSGIPKLTVYDIPSGSKTFITTNVDNRSFPHIYGTRFVWSANESVYMRDMSTSTQTKIGNGNGPDIYDTKVVYTSDVEPSDYRSVRMYDIDTKKTITVCSEGDPYAPHIYGNNIIWSDFYNRLGHIRMYDIISKNTIDVTNAHSYIGEPINSDQGEDTGVCAAINGNKIVYAKVSNDIFGSTGVYVYDISRGLNNSVVNFPADMNTKTNIYGNTIVWVMVNGTGIYVTRNS